MPSSCPAISQPSESLLNISSVLQQRWEDSPKDDRKRLELCWGYNDCGDCHRSEGHCGWCAISSTCLPLPMDPLSHAFPLLSPMRYKFICATGPERFELRTSGLGCQVSTITFLTSIVTIFCTLFGVLVLYFVFYASHKIGSVLKGRGNGWVVYGNGNEGVWVRRGKSWGEWWGRVTGRLSLDETSGIAGPTRQRPWWTRVLTRREPRSAIDEGRPLLD